MNDAGRVGPVEGSGDLPAEQRHTTQLERCSGEHGAQGCAVYPLNDDEGLTALFADIVNGHNRWVVERRGRAGLPQRMLQSVRSFLESEGRRTLIATVRLRSGSEAR